MTIEPFDPFWFAVGYGTGVLLVLLTVAVVSIIAAVKRIK